MIDSAQLDIWINICEIQARKRKDGQHHVVMELTAFFSHIAAQSYEKDDRSSDNEQIGYNDCKKIRQNPAKRKEQKRDECVGVITSAVAEIQAKQEWRRFVLCTGTQDDKFRAIKNGQSIHHSGNHAARQAYL